MGGILEGSFRNDNRGDRDTIGGWQTVLPLVRKVKHSTSYLVSHVNLTRVIWELIVISTFQVRILSLGEKMGLEVAQLGGHSQGGLCLSSMNMMVPKKSLVTGNQPFPSPPAGTVTTLLPTGFL